MYVQTIGEKRPGQSAATNRDLLKYFENFFLCSL